MRRRVTPRGAELVALASRGANLFLALSRHTRCGYSATMPTAGERRALYERAASAIRHAQQIVTISADLHDARRLRQLVPDTSPRARSDSETLAHLRSRSTGGFVWGAPVSSSSQRSGLSGASDGGSGGAPASARAMASSRAVPGEKPPSIPRRIDRCPAIGGL